MLPLLRQRHKSVIPITLADRPKNIRKQMITIEYKRFINDFVLELQNQS